MLVQDVRYAMRQLRRSPGFAITVLCTLALSVGVATAVFCVINAVILRPLPFAHPEKIVNIVSRSQSGYTQPASWPSYADERAQTSAFAALAGYTEYNKITVDTPSAGPVLLPSVRGTENFFQVFGVAPLFGRTYVPGEEQDGKNQVAVLSYDLWQTYFGGSREVLGQQVKLDGRSYTIIGVMPAGFRFPLNMRNAIYFPLRRDQAWMSGRGSHWLRTVGRIKDGVTREQAQADLSRVFSDLGKAYEDTDGGRTVRLELLANSVVGTSKGPLWILFGAVLAVLAIGCVNIAGLLLARGVKREREMAMRMAIGAGRGRLLWQLLTEGLILSVFGAIGGISMAWMLLRVMRTFLIHALMRGADVQLNWTVLAAAIGVAVIASLGSSLYPALRLSGVDPGSALKAGGSAGTQRSQHRLRSGFIITQVALTMVLLVVAGLLIRVVTRYRHADLGFDAGHILATDLNLAPPRYEGRDIVANFYQPLFERIAHLPGVRAVGVINILPIENWGSNSDIQIAGQPPNPPNEVMLAEGRLVSTGYFEVFGIPLHGGRPLSPSLDRPDNVGSNVVVNDAFVRKFIPSGLDPTAQRIVQGDKPEDWEHIVGVVGNVRQDIYEEPLAEQDWLMNAVPFKDRAVQLSSMSLVLRFEGDSGSIVAGLRSALHEIDPTVPFIAPRSMTEVVDETLVFERMEGWLFGIFAALALVLALVGLFGLSMQEVEQSTREIGVRMALGATRAHVLARVMLRAAWMLAAGVTSGVLLTVMIRKVIGVVIYFEAEREASGLLLVGFTLLLAGLTAAFVPALRAASIEPVNALRTE
jgi:predicted permease